MQRDGQHPRQGAQAESHDEDQREHDVRHGPAELEQPDRGEAHHARAGEVAAGKHGAGDAQHGTGRSPDIGDQQRFAELKAPAAQAPEPVRHVRPDSLAGVEFGQPAEVTAEVSELVPEGIEPDLRADTGKQGRDHEKYDAGQNGPAPGRYGPGVTVEQRPQLRFRRHGDGLHHAAGASPVSRSACAGGRRR